MIHLLILAVHLLATIAKLLRPDGVRVVVAESLLLKHQLVISNRARRRAPNLNSFDRATVYRRGRRGIAADVDYGPEGTGTGAGSDARLPLPWGCHGT